MGKLIDPFGREVTYVRLSVTDRCDLRCVYCMAETMSFLPKKEVLSLEELALVAESFIDLGVTKIRLTGGEPLVRRDVMTLVRALCHYEGVEVAVTTNATQLSRFAEALFEAGVRRVNISLDTLRAERFKAITRWGDFDQVMSGIHAASRAGLKIKINMVALKNFNGDEIDSMMRFCADRGFDMTLIEVMPMGDLEGGAALDGSALNGGLGNSGLGNSGLGNSGLGNGGLEVDSAEGDARFGQYWNLSELRAELEQRWTLEALEYRSGGPARYVRVRENGLRLGFITPLAHRFCEDCNRVRVTCTGRLYLCLGQDESADLRSALRAAMVEGRDAKRALKSVIKGAVARKPEGHDFIIERARRNVSQSRYMSTTGG